MILSPYGSPYRCLSYLMVWHFFITGMAFRLKYHRLNATDKNKENITPKNDGWKNRLDYPDSNRCFQEFKAQNNRNKNQLVVIAFYEMHQMIGMFGFQWLASILTTQMDETQSRSYKRSVYWNWLKYPQTKTVKI